MTVTFLTSVFILCCAVDSGLFKQLPEYINVCKWDPDTINDCARHSIEALRPTLIKGISELDVPGIDPFYIEQVIPVTGGTSPIKATGRDIKVTGAGNFTLKSLDVDLDTFTIKARVRFPKLHFEGRYKIDTQILVRINGEGTLTADAVKCDADLVLRGQVTEHDGAEYINFTALDMDINIKDYKLRLEGLFNGDKVLGEAANEAINQNRGEFLRSSKPYIEKTVSDLLLELANKIVKDLTVAQLLPKP